MMPKLSGKNILVAGGAGFIGSHLVDRLIDEGVSKIIVVDNFFLGKKKNLKEAGRRFEKLSIYKQDASFYGAMKKIISHERVEVVYNLATKALPYSFIDPLDAYMVNVNIAGCLLELLRKKLYKTLIHFSSSEAYGTGKTVRMAENHPLNPHTPYAAGKAAADMMVLAYHKIFDLDVAIIRPFNTYGPRQNEGSYAAVIPLTVKRILGGEEPVLEGDGDQTRDFTYVDDVAGAAIAIYKSRETRGKVINIANGKETKIKTIINLVAKHLKYRGKIARKPARIGDVRRHCADIGLAKYLINFEPRTGLKEGLRRTVDWYYRNLKILKS